MHRGPHEKGGFVFALAALLLALAAQRSAALLGGVSIDTDTTSPVQCSPTETALLLNAWTRARKSTNLHR
jgi:hypothetical protein